MKTYFCLKCKRNHYRGKIYEDHLKYSKKINKNNNPNHNKESSIPSNEIVEFDFNKLRPIARRQIRRLVIKMHQTKEFRFYRKQINKLLLYEKKMLV